MFDPVSPQVSFTELDATHLAFWEDARIFEKTLEGGDDKKAFIFYEGPRRRTACRTRATCSHA